MPIRLDRRSTFTRCIAFLGLVAPLAACEMLPAEVLDSPRILAIRATPAGLVEGGTLTLDALTFSVTGDVSWSMCPVAWTPSDPLSCPTRNAVTLGAGNPLNASLDVPDGATSVWIRAEADDALPAVRLLKVSETIVNPTVLGLQTADGAGLPETVAPASSLEMRPLLDATTDPETTITSWYVTAGTLEPARTVGTASATLTVPDSGAATPITVIAVTRNTDGGTAWTSASVEVAQ